MNLNDKYAGLVQYAQASNVRSLTVTERDNVLYVTGIATAPVKDRIWILYNEIDPDMRSGDLVLKIDVDPGGEEMYEVKSGDSLSKIAKNYPGMTWQKIFEANKGKIKDPDLIYPGQKLIIPM